MAPLFPASETPRLAQSRPSRSKPLHCPVTLGFRVVFVFVSFLFLFSFLEGGALPLCNTPSPFIFLKIIFFLFFFPPVVLGTEPRSALLPSYTPSSFLFFEMGSH